MAKQSKQAQEAQEAPPPPPPSPPKQATVNGTMVVAPDQDPWDLSGAYYIGPNGGHVWHPLVPPPPIPADQLDWSGFETAGQGFWEAERAAAAAEKEAKRKAQAKGRSRPRQI